MTFNNQKSVENLTDPWQAQLKKGTLEMAALAALWSGPLYGLEILRFLETKSELVLAEGTIYPILTSEWVEAEAGHPRKYYSLTASGRERIRHMAAVWVDFSANLRRLIQPVLDQKGQKEEKR
jgi:PadR family transcriptional regulator PadR